MLSIPTPFSKRYILTAQEGLIAQEYLIVQELSYYLSEPDRPSALSGRFLHIVKLDGKLCIFRRSVCLVFIDTRVDSSYRIKDGRNGNVVIHIVD